MTTIKITGGHKLHGEVAIHSAKNAILPMLAASLLFENDRLIFDNIPNIKDVNVMIQLLTSIGIRTNFTANELIVDIPFNSELQYETPETLVSQMRATLLIMGPMLAKKHKVEISLPGGCSIGYRPINLHMDALELMGATIHLDHGILIAEAPNGLHAAEIHLDIPSVGATENIIMAAVLTEGVTIIDNAAKEPEIVDLVHFLNLAGADIRGAGTSIIEIRGVSQLKANPHPYEVIPDRIEAATYMIAVASTGGEVVLTNVIAAHLDAIISKLREIGVVVHVDANQDKITVIAQPPYMVEHDIDIKTATYPGFATDIQPIIFALLLQLNRNTFVADTIFKNRFQHIEEFNKLGVRTTQLENTVIIDGENTVSSGKIKATDLRTAASMLLVGISQPIELEIDNIDMLNRGYQDLIKNLNKLGADIEVL